MQQEFVINVKANGTERFAENTMDMSKGMDQTAESMKETRKEASLLTDAFRALETAAKAAAISVASGFAKIAAKTAIKVATSKALGLLETYGPAVSGGGVVAREISAIRKADSLEAAADGLGKTVEEFQTLSQIAKATKTDVKELASILSAIGSSQRSALGGDKDLLSAFTTLGAGRLSRQTPLGILAAISGRRFRNMTEDQIHALSRVAGGAASGNANLFQADISGVLAGFDGLQVSGSQISGLARVAESVRTEQAIKLQMFAKAAGALDLGHRIVGGAAEMTGINLNLLGLSGAGDYFRRAAYETELSRLGIWDNLSEGQNKLGGDDAEGARLRSLYDLKKILRASRTPAENAASTPAENHEEKIIPRRQRLEPFSVDALARIGGFSRGQGRLEHRADEQLRVSKQIASDLRVIKGEFTDDL